MKVSMLQIGYMKPCFDESFSISQVMEVVEMARRAKEAGSTRFCMGTQF
jgi:biotin synthase-like enzyme